jgi:hypothetical protein
MGHVLGAGAGSVSLAPSRQVVLSSQATGLLRLRNEDRDTGDVVKLREPLVR